MYRFSTSIQGVQLDSTRSDSGWKVADELRHGSPLSFRVLFSCVFQVPTALSCVPRECCAEGLENCA